jgi:hypothetical protein
MAVSTVNDDKKKALNLAIAQIEKNCGKGAIMKMDSADARVRVDAIPTGVFTSHPTTVQFQIEGRQSEQPEFQVSASNSNGDPIRPTRQNVLSYSDRNGDQFRREVWQVTSPIGVCR